MSDTKVMYVKVPTEELKDYYGVYIHYVNMLITQKEFKNFLKKRKNSYRMCYLKAATYASRALNQTYEKFSENAYKTPLYVTCYNLIVRYGNNAISDEEFKKEVDKYPHFRKNSTNIDEILEKAKDCALFHNKDWDAVFNSYKLRKSGKNKRSVSRENKDKNILSKIDELNDKDKLFDLLKGWSLEELGELKKSINNYIRTNYSDEKELLKKEKEMNKKIDSYIIYLSRENAKKNFEKQQEIDQFETNLFPVAREKIISFVENGNGDLREFCRINDVKIDDFQLYVSLVERYDLELYNTYIELVKKNKEETYKKMKDKFVKVVDYMKYGVEVNGKKRSFDIIDYFNYLGFSSLECRRIGKNVLNPTQNKILENFLDINQDYDVKIDPEILINENISINNKEIGLDEKKEVIKWLNLNRVPINKKTFMAALQRYLNGTLNDFEEE